MSDPRWSTGKINQSGFALDLVTRPGVVGGEFHAILSGLHLRHSDKAHVTISCTGFEASSHNFEYRSSSPNTYFLESEEFEASNSGLEIRFLIPIEAKGTNEGASWRLALEFESGTTEFFEIPVCRTPESNSEINKITLSSFGRTVDKPKKNTLQKNDPIGQQKPFEFESDHEKLFLRIPCRVPGKPTLAKGFGILYGCVLAMAVLFYFIFEGDLEPMILMGVPVGLLSIFIPYLLFGDSTVEVDEEQMVIRHRLFGLAIPKRILRCDVNGFSASCLGKLSKDGASYILNVEKKDSSTPFLSGALLDRNDSQTVVKRLNQFWDFV